MPRFAYVNGRYLRHVEAAVGIEDRGLQFADSIYEVVALIDGHLADEQGHLDRLERSLSELQIAMPVTRQSLQISMRHLIRMNKTKNGALYIQITRGRAKRDFAFPEAIRPSVIMTLHNASFNIEKRKASTKQVITSPDIRWQRRDVKTTGLLAQVLAKQNALDSGADDAWMLDDKGFVTEASASNAWIVDKKGNLITRPSKGNVILKGVTRTAMQELCAKNGIKLVERAFTLKEAYTAAEAFMSSAVMLIVPVSHIDGRKIGKGTIGPITSQIYDLYMSYATDKTAKQKKWNP